MIKRICILLLLLVSASVAHAQQVVVFTPHAAPAGGFDATENLVFFLELEEASGTRVDAHSTLDFTPSGTPGSRTGKIGDALDLDDASSQYIDRADEAAIRVGTNSFVVSMWVLFDDLQSSMPIGRSNGGTNTEWRVIGGGNAGAPRVSLQVRSTGGTPYVTPTVDFTYGTWTHVCGYYDTSTGVAGISVDGAAFETVAATTGGLNSTTLPLRIGSRSDSATLLMDGSVDQVGFWIGASLDYESICSTTYNSGAGVAYSDL